MDIIQAKIFWKKIIEFADITGCVEGEGNSGEFHNGKDAARLHKERNEILENLINLFFEVTGFKPAKIILSYWWHEITPSRKTRCSINNQENWYFKGYRKNQLIESSELVFSLPDGAVIIHSIETV